VGEKRLGIFNQQDQQFLEAFSLSAVGAIENARAHSVLEAAYQELQRLDEVKDKFIQVANHELRTPLALLKGYVMLLSGDQMSVEEKSGAVDIATEQANVLQALLDRILDIERLARNEFLVELVEVDPLALTEAVVERFRLLAQSKEVALQLKSSDAVKPVWLDQAKYETVLTNLLDNAVAFAPYQGIVEVTVQVQADGFAAAVRDNGPGIPTEEHQRIFERFYQIENPLRRRHEGVGLGLSIAREMAELCGGQLEVESVVGQGATFTYRQPIKPNIILA
jgi:signal transduction histidine kinase